jgi:hypothetical protein
MKNCATGSGNCEIGEAEGEVRWEESSGEADRDVSCVFGRRISYGARNGRNEMNGSRVSYLQRQRRR